MIEICNIISGLRWEKPDGDAKLMGALANWSGCYNTYKRDNVENT